MKCYVQWATENPGDWWELDSRDWNMLPSKPIPDAHSTLDSNAGWLNTMNIQGVNCHGFDHIYVADDGDDCVVTLWNDDTDDWLDQQHAHVIRFRPLAPRQDLGGAINPYQTRTVYTTPQHRGRILRASGGRPPVGWELKDWGDFVAPSGQILHGIWMDDAKYYAHHAACTHHGWREWTEGCPASEVENGKIRCQRKAGKWNKARGTITYYHTNTDLAVGNVSADDEKEGNTTDPDSPTTLNTTVPANGGYQLAVTSQSGSPNDSDWPNGDYRCQWDVDGAGATVTYGAITVENGNGRFVVLQSDLSTERETFVQDESAFSGTGTPIATNTHDPGAGATGDRYCVICAGAHTGHGNSTLDLEVGNSDSFMDGPWVAATVELEIKRTELGVP
jgi:nitrite reductase/ring-hydroxylating ferredoxin subunit